MTDGQVPSPMHQALQDLWATVNENLASVADALKDPNQRMQSKTVWVGSTADTWASDLSGHAGGLSGNAHSFLDYVYQQLQATPALVTPQVARMENRMLNGQM